MTEQTPPAAKRYLTSNTVEVRFDIERLTTTDEGDDWLRSFVRRMLEQGVAPLRGGRIAIEYVRIVD